jgi:hypothetical protein
VEEDYTFRPIFRSFLESKQFENALLCKIWLWCLLKATTKPYKAIIGRQEVDLKPGQFIFGRKKAAEKLNMSESTVWFYMKWLEDDRSIDIKSNNKFSVISILNWDKFQQILDSLLNNKKTTKRQQKDTYEKDKKDNKEIIVKVFNFFLEKFGKNPNQYKLTDGRKIKIGLRLDDAGEEMLLKAIENTSQSPFHRGDNNRNWQADLDFIVRSYENVEKLANMEIKDKVGDSGYVATDGKKFKNEEELNYYLDQKLYYIESDNQGNIKKIIPNRSD